VAIGRFGIQDVPEVKLVPPPLPGVLLARRGLERRLDAAVDRRLVALVGGAGFGKTTALTSWARQARPAWYSLDAEDADPTTLARGLFHALRLRVPELVPDVSLTGDAPRGPEAGQVEQSRAVAYASFLASALHERLQRRLVLVLDDVHELGPSGPAVALVEALCRQAPPDLTIVLASRSEPPFPVERLRAQGRFEEIGPAQLRFDLDELTDLLDTELGEGAGADLAPGLHDRTHGWPAAVRLAIEVLHDVPPDSRAAALASGSGAGPQATDERVFAFLAEDVMARLEPDLVELIRVVAPLERFSAELLTELGIAGAGPHVQGLERRGLFLVPLTTRGWYALHPLVRDFARQRLALDPGHRQLVLRTAGAWFERAREVEAALHCYAAAGAPDTVARLLGAHGSALVAAGRGTRVRNLCRELPPDLRATTVIRQVEGEACYASGDWQAALDRFGRIAEGRPLLPTATAWRMGLMHHLRGEIDEALAVYHRAEGLEPGAEATRDDALVRAWWAAALWLRGDLDGCQAHAAEAAAMAQACGDHGAAAAAHTALAMAAAMADDRRANDAHYLIALDHAEQAGDALQIIRIRANRGSRYLEEGSYEDALRELEVALRLSERAGFGSLRALALLNRGEALYRLGRLEEAQRDLLAARTAYEANGSRMVSYALASLGDVHAVRGESALARACFEEGLRIADEVGDIQGVVPALSAMADLLAPTDPDEARRLAERAVDYATSLEHQWALLSAARVALQVGDRDVAAKWTDLAGSRARSRRDRQALAEVLDLEAALSDDDAVALSCLAEARALWEELGDPVGLARADLAVAARATDREHRDRRALAVAAAERARTVGARPLAARATALLAALDRQATPDLEVQSLGGFAVLRAGVPVRPAEWQSRKARDLLKLLVARRGQPTHREQLIEALWPPTEEGADGRSGSRLSVALSTLRAILDPAKEHDSDHFVVADGDALRLRLEHVRVDVEAFLAAAAGAVEAHGEGRADAIERMAAAESMYRGDFLADDPYSDAHVALRERARSAFLQVVRLLAQAHLRADDRDSAARYLLRLLEGDPYDEGASLDLVRVYQQSGRYGEARRAYHGYCGHMEELGVEPAPFAAI
jgi:DNA-binding SARP family transcriptional activator